MCPPGRTRRDGGNEETGEDPPEVTQMLALMEEIFTNLGGDDAARVCTTLEQMLPVSADPVTAALFVSFDGIRAVVGAMRNHSTSSSVQISGCAVLMNLGHDIHPSVQEHRNKISTDGGLDAILDAMQTFEDNVGVQDECCKALSNFTMSDSSGMSLADKIHELGGIDRVIDAMNRFPDAEDLQANGCGALMGLARHNSKNATYVLENDGLRAILAAMRTWPSNANLQMTGCCALCHIAENQGGDFGAPIIEAGGVDLILEAMKNHSTVAGVVRNGSNALGSLFAKEMDDGNSGAVSELASSINEIAKAIVKGMKDEPSNVTLQQESCSALWSLAGLNFAKPAIAQEGGIDAIIEAMSTHVEEAMLQYYACGALRAMACDMEINMTMIRHSGACAAIVRAMEAHPRNEKVQEGACAAFWNMASGGTSCQASVASSEAIRAIVDIAMTNNESHPGVLEHAIGALWNLAQHMHGVPVMEAGGIDRIVQAMLAHPRALGLQKEGVGALYHLSRTDDERVKEALLQTRASEAIMRAMYVHGSCFEIFGLGVEALSNLEAMQNVSDEDGTDEH